MHQLIISYNSYTPYFLLYRNGEYSNGIPFLEPNGIFFTEKYETRNAALKAAITEIIKAEAVSEHEKIMNISLLTPLENFNDTKEFIINSPTITIQINLINYA